MEKYEKAPSALNKGRLIRLAIVATLTLVVCIMTTTTILAGIQGKASDSLAIVTVSLHCAASISANGLTNLDHRWTPGTSAASIPPAYA